ncbi:MAG: cytochrome b [Rhodanobacter sp.]
MKLRSNDHQWGSVSKFFHWAIALAILCNGSFGLLMDLASSPMQKINWLALHKSIGLTVLALVLLRMLWRWGDGRPAEQPASALQMLAARLVHGVLYLVILAIPLTGWWFNSVSGKPLQWFKLFNLPPLAAKNDAMRDFAHGVHEYLYWFLLLLLVVHVGAAVKHHVFENDNVLRRMLPFGRPRQPSEGDRP